MEPVPTRPEGIQSRYLPAGSAVGGTRAGVRPLRAWGGGCPGGDGAGPGGADPAGARGAAAGLGPGVPAAPRLQPALSRRRLGPDVCAVLRLSAPLKEQYAQVGAPARPVPPRPELSPGPRSHRLRTPQEHGLDFPQLLGAGDYKERYRQDMIRWGEERRRADPGFFCRAAVRGAVQPVWVSAGRPGRAGGLSGPAPDPRPARAHSRRW